MPQNRKRQTRRGMARRKTTITLLAVAALAIGIVVSVAMLTSSDPAEMEAPAAADRSSTPYSGGPRLAVDQREFDYGSVAYGENVAASYELRNVGDAPVVIGQPRVLTLEGC